jgi:hypothetical protein
MMGVVNLDHKISNRELQLVRPKPTRLGLRCKSVPPPKCDKNASGRNNALLWGRPQGLDYCH